MNPSATLTRREREIAELIAWGMTKKEIAHTIHRSIRTVENITRSIYEKTGVTKSNELSAWWFCVNYHISFKLSPLKKVIISLFFLISFLPFVITQGGEMIRESRVRECRCREEQNDIYPILT